MKTQKPTFSLKRAGIVNGKQSGSKAIAIQHHVFFYGMFKKKHISTMVAIQNNVKYIIQIGKGQINYYYASDEILAYLKDNKSDLNLEVLIEENLDIDINFLLDTSFHEDLVLDI